MNKSMLVMILSVSLFALAVQAQTVTWDGSGDMNWTQPDSTSWSAETYDAGYNVNFLGAGAGTVAIDGDGVTPGNILIDSSASYTFTGGSISASGALTKSGSGTLTLSNASNDFSGDTIEIDGGTLHFSTLGAWGGANKNVTFTGDGNLGNRGSPNITGGNSGGTLAVNEGVLATINTPDGGALTFADTTGDGDITFRVRSTGGNRRLELGNASTFNGTLRGELAGNANQNDGHINIQFSSIGDAEGSALQFVNSTGGNNNSGQAYTIALAGDSGPLTFNHRRIEILERLGGNHNIRDNNIANNNSNSANIWVINTDLVKTCDQTRNFRLGGSNTGDNEFAGVISDGSGVLNLRKFGSGKWILSGENTYSGTTTVEAGTLGLNGDYSLPHEGTLNRTGGTIHIEGRAAVAVLQANGVALPPGIYGSTDSHAQFNGEMLEIDAETEIANFFSGTGLLYVDTPFPPSGTLIILQ